MSNITYPVTVVRTDAHTYQAGEVVRPAGNPGRWSDCIILGFSHPTKFGDVFVKLARPHCYASCIGTTGPTVLTGTEVFSITLTQLQRDRVVDPGRPMVSGSELPIDRGYDDEVLDLRTAVSDRTAVAV